MKTRKNSIIGSVLAMALLLIISAGVAQADIIAHWKLNETTGQVAYDDNSQLHNGRLGNSTASDENDPSQGAAGKFGSAYSFDGSYEYVCVADADDLDGMQSFTTSLWFNMPAALSEQRTIMGKWGASNSYRSYLFKFGNGGEDFCGYFRCSDNSTKTVAFAVNGNITYGKWQHLTYVFDGANGAAKIYLNGEQKGITTFAAGTALNAVATDLYIGMQDITSAGSWLGGLDDVGMFSESLSAGKIKSLWSVAQPEVSGLNSYDVGKMNILFDVYDTGESNTIDSVAWNKVTGLTGGEGDAWMVGDTYFVQLDGTGGGVSGAVPEPGALVLLATALLGLMAYAWKKRK